MDEVQKNRKLKASNAVLLTKSRAESGGGGGGDGGGVVIPWP
jgi:hypothetical protein